MLLFMFPPFSFSGSDIEFPEKFSELDCGPYEGSNLRNSSSESHSPGGSSNSVGGMSESSIVTVQESNSKNGVLGKMVNCDIHHTIRSECGCQAPVMETIRPSIEHGQDFVESDDEKPLVSFIVSNKKVKSSVKVTKGGTLLRQKRLRKPTKRYIEEFSRNSTTSGKDKCLKVRSQEEFSQVPSESQPRRGRPKKIVQKMVELPLSALFSLISHFSGLFMFLFIIFIYLDIGLECCVVAMKPREPQSTQE